MSVSSSDIIDLGNSLLERYPESFTDNFNGNKHRVEQLTEIQSKRVRNRVAGYITREQPGKNERDRRTTS